MGILKMNQKKSPQVRSMNWISSSRSLSFFLSKNEFVLFLKKKKNYGKK